MYGYSVEQLSKVIRLNQDERLIRVRTVLDPDPFVVHRFQGSEAVSAPFAFSIQLLAVDAHLELKKIVGQPLLLTMQTDHGARHFHGYVKEFARTGTDGGLVVYQADIAPWFAFLQYASNCRIFQDLTVLEIVEEVFAGYADIAKYRYDLSVDRYPKLDYCVQYNESDFAFVSRLLEDVGIYYVFEHELDGHTMVLADDSTVSAPIDGSSRVRFLLDQGASAEGGIDEWNTRRRVASSIQALKSFDFKQPTNALAASRPLDIPLGALPALESYRYDGAARYFDSAIGEALASLRAEEVAWQTKLFEGAGDHRGLQTGRYFVLHNHFDHMEADEDERKFFVVDVRHDARNNFRPDFSDVEDSIYRCTLTSLRRKIAFRPLRVTPPQRMPGLQTATVVGPPGEEIYDDKYGRVKVQFHWDRQGQFNESSSCWVRVAGPWAGADMGGVSPPRIGQEVVVDFLDGDPDRPLIVGRVYNENNMPPFGSNVSGMKSKTVKGEGYNGLTMTDTAGSQGLDIHAQKDMSTTVLNDQNNSIGNNKSSSVAVNDSLSVGADQSISVGGNRGVTVTGNETVGITGNSDTTVSGSATRAVTGTSDTTVTGAVSHTYEAGQTLTIAAAGYNESITGDYGSVLDGNYTSHRNGTSEQVVTGTSLMQVGGKVTEEMGAGREVTVIGMDKRGVDGAVEDSNIGARTISVDGALEQGVSGTCAMSSGGDMTIGSASMVVIGAGEASGIMIELGKITISSNGSTIVIDGGGVSINGALVKMNC
ncbi:MAG: type VI secretion system tip protein VgrG [Xanthomonadaceae bacterium]|jgi:type VI secretion system secreted protein VgrG|nr:type VI secretion system tip protein VgrG [Xanthomonadaceae bacterium]